MKAVLISIRPEWCDTIVRGEKTLEIRKTRPYIDTPFKCYIYCTKAPKGWFWLNSTNVRRDGKVIGEFICDSIRIFDVPYPAFQSKLDKEILKSSCLTYWQLHRYAYHDCLFGWHISDLKIYDKPKPISDFRKKCDNDLYCESCAMYSNNTGACGNAALKLTHAPQSWRYVDEM